MIVPMKKVSLITVGDQKTETLRKLRELGTVHIEITEGSGERLDQLRGQIALLESALYSLGKVKKAEQNEASASEALSVAAKIISLSEEKQQCLSEQIALNAEIERLKDWGDIDIQSISDLQSEGVDLYFYEMSKSEYAALPESIRTVRLDSNRSTVKFLLLKPDSEEGEEVVSSMSGCRLSLPQMSTAEMRQRISDLGAQVEAIDEQMESCGCYVDGMKRAIEVLEKEIEFETYATGMDD